MDFRTCQRKLSIELDIFKDNHEIEAELNGLNMEDGLSAQDNETFCLASLAFLQQHTKRKLGALNEEQSDLEADRKKFKRTYSNMLLFETPATDYNGQKERFYLKLKNSDKFENILKHETIYEPSCALSQEQMLPVKVKNPKRFTKLFGAGSKTKGLSNMKGKPPPKRKIDADASVTSKTSIFSIFKGANRKKIKTNHEPCEQAYKQTRNYGEDWTWEVSQKFQQDPRHKEELKVIKKLNHSKDNSVIKISVNEKLRARKSESLSTVDQFILDNTPLNKQPNKNSVKILAHEYYDVDKKKGKHKKLSRPLSKISVCFEESDSQSEEGYYHKPQHHPNSTKHKRKEEMRVESLKVEKTSSQMSGFTNFSDELKAYLSPEVLQNIISEMIVCLEDAPNQKAV